MVFDVPTLQEVMIVKLFKYNTMSVSFENNAKCVTVHNNVQPRYCSNPFQDHLFMLVYPFGELLDPLLKFFLVLVMLTKQKRWSFIVFSYDNQSYQSKVLSRNS